MFGVFIEAPASAALKTFNFHSFGKLRERVVDVREKLNQVQSKLLNNLTDPLLMDDERKCLKEYHDFAYAEEGFLKQKSRVQWLKLGDQNTNYFHKAVKARNARNAIKIITSGNGCSIEDPVAIKEEAVRYFKDILCVDGPRSAEYSTDGFVWSQQHLNILNGEISREEVKMAMFLIDDNKAPGPDGFSSRVFKAAWSIIGSDVVDAVISFFKSGSILHEINCTIIALVPKVPNPESMNDYRPISCCNTVYKCISKIIAARFN